MRMALNRLYAIAKGAGSPTPTPNDTFGCTFSKSMLDKMRKSPTPLRILHLATNYQCLRLTDEERLNDSSLKLLSGRQGIQMDYNWKLSLINCRKQAQELVSKGQINLSAQFCFKKNSNPFYNDVLKNTAPIDLLTVMHWNSLSGINIFE